MQLFVRFSGITDGIIEFYIGECCDLFGILSRVRCFAKVHLDSWILGLGQAI